MNLLKTKKKIAIILIILTFNILVILMGYLFINMDGKEANYANKIDNLPVDTNLEDDQEEEEFKILFESNGGSRIDSQKVVKGEKITKPANPSRDGYTFIEWQLDDSAYDFESEVTKDLILKAKWEKIEEKEENTTTTNNNNTHSSSNNTSSSSSASSTIAKINLNENVGVSIYSTIGGCVYNYLFITNLKDVFPQITGATFSLDDPNGNAVESIPYEEWTNNFSKLVFDVEKENKAINALEKLSQTPYKGIADLNYYNNNHYIGYDYYYLRPSDSNYYKNIYDNLNMVKNNYQKEINTILSGSYAVCVGGAGNDPEKTALNEELCQKYNLNCDRW